MINTLLSALIPILFIMAIGFVARKKKYVNGTAGKNISTIVLKYTLPALLFYTFATTPIHAIWNAEFVVAMLLTTLISYFITFVYTWKVQKKVSDAGIAALAVGWPNTVFLGLPLLILLFGTEAVLPIALGSIITMLTAFPISIIFLEKGSKGEGNAFVKAGLHKNPILLSSLVGIICAALNIHVPDVILNSARLLDLPTSTIALFATGIAIADNPIVITRHIVVNMILKNFVQPLLGIICIIFFHMHGFWAGMLLLSLACPSANTPLMLSLKYRTYEQEAVSTIIFSTVCFIGTIFIFYPIALHI